MANPYPTANPIFLQIRIRLQFERADTGLGRCASLANFGRFPFCGRHVLMLLSNVFRGRATRFPNGPRSTPPLSFRRIVSELIATSVMAA